MPKKQPPRRSIDGFIPQSNHARRVGFENMKKPLNQQAANFPAIGQTLSTYAPSQARPQPLVRPNLGKPAPSPFDLDIEDQPSADKRKQKQKRSGLRKWLGWKRLLTYLLIIVLCLGGWLGFKFIYNASKTFNGNIFGAFSTSKLKGEDVGRVNVLLAGNSSDDPGHDGANLTDSIMILSLDTRNNTAFMMSIPRDLYVEIPGYGHAKINEAYVDGQTGDFSESGYFPGGMGLLQEVIQNNFDITLNYYALINYEALKDMVNAVGGITINVQSDDPRGLYDPSIDWTTHKPLVKLSNGKHTLNGEQALDLARARGDAYGSYGFPASDFDRTENQRKELMALKSKVMSANVLANPVTVSKLTDSVGKNIVTNMTLSEARRAYDLVKKVGNIQSVGLNDVNGKNLLASYTTYSGQSALIPAAGLDDFSDIQELMQQLTSNNPIVREGARVVVLNGTDTSGLAGAAAKKLDDQNVDVVTTGDAASPQAKTVIIDVSRGGMNATKSLLTKLYGNNVTTTNPYDGTYDADFILVLGADRVPASTSSNP